MVDRIAVCLAALAMLTCPVREDEQAPTKQEVEAIARAAKQAAEATLEPPRASEPDAAPVPWSYPDRVWSVRGLLDAAQTLIDAPDCTVLVRGRVRQHWIACPEGERCPPDYAWAMLADPDVEDPQLDLRVVDFDIPLTEGETYVLSGRLVRFDWLWLPEQFGLELIAVVTQDPGLEPVVLDQCEIPPRFANPPPAGSDADLRAVAELRSRREQSCGPKVVDAGLRAVELAPDDPVKLFELARAQTCTGRRRDARQTIDRVLEHADDPALESWMVEEARCMRSRLAEVLDDVEPDPGCTRFKRLHYK